MRKVRYILSAAAFIIIILFVFLSIAMLTGSLNEKDITVTHGYAELSQFDFNHKLAYIPYNSYLYYDKALYTPEDFASENVNINPVILNSGVDQTIGDYGTCRITLKLPQDGVTYGLSSYSAMYAQRLFVNGKEYPPVGTVGDTKETTVPKATHYTVYFTPDMREVEILVQFSNFVHSGPGGVLPMYLGTSDMIVRRDALAQQRINILTGCAITAFLFFAGLFFFFRKRLAFLWFSLICLSSGIRMLIMDEKAIMILFPDMSWNLSIGLEYMALIVLVLSIFLYFHSMFEGALHKAVLWVFMGVCAPYAALVILTPPIIYTQLIYWFEVCAAATGVYVVGALVYNIICKKDNRHPEHVLILTGVFIYVALSILGIRIFGTTIKQSIALGLSEIGMIVLIFINMIAMVIGFFRIETELDEALRKEREMQETNLFLDRMGRLKSDFMANISHEMRTPLTVMSSYAGLTAMEIERGAVNEKTLENLQTVKREAIRLADMVEQLKDVSLENDRRLALSAVSALSVLKQAALFCGPICQNNKNKVTFDVEPEDIMLHVNPESIFQTLVNIITNANRHTKGGTIRLQVKPDADSGFAAVSVADDGEGIDPGLLPVIFKRSVSGDGSSGLGLTICKEIVEEHGGRIWVESERGRGTTVYLTLPINKGE